MAKTLKDREKFPVLNETTISGFSAYDDSYISAVLDAMRNIAEKYMGIEKSKKGSTATLREYLQNLRMGRTTNGFNFGDSLRLRLQDDNIVRLDVFPNPQKRPTQNFTIIVKNFMVKSISKDFSIKQLDHLLEKSAFEIKTPVSLQDGILEITCIFKTPNIEGIEVLNSKGFGVPSDKRLHKDRL